MKKKERQAKWHQRYIEDLQQMKEKEKETPEGLSNGRRRWFNQEIQKSKDKIQEPQEQNGEDQ